MEQVEEPKIEEQPQVEEQPKVEEEPKKPSHDCNLLLCKKLYCEANNLDEKRVHAVDNGDGEGVFFVVDGRKVFASEYCICERLEKEPDLKIMEIEMKKQIVRDEFRKIRDYKYLKKILEFLGKTEDELLF